MAYTIVNPMQSLFDRIPTADLQLLNGSGLNTDTYQSLVNDLTKIGFDSNTINQIINQGSGAGGQYASTALNSRLASGQAGPSLPGGSTTPTPPTSTGGTSAPPVSGGGGSASATPFGSLAPRVVGTWQPPTTPAAYAGLTPQGRMGYVAPYQNYVSQAQQQTSGINQTGVQINAQGIKPTVTGPATPVNDPSYVAAPSHLDPNTGNLIRNSDGAIIGVGPYNPGATGGTSTGGTGGGTTGGGTTGGGGGTVAKPKVATPFDFAGAFAKEDNGSTTQQNTDGSITNSTGSNGGSSTSTSDKPSTGADAYQWTIWKPNQGGNSYTPFTQTYNGQPSPFASLQDQIASAFSGFNVYNPLSWASQNNPALFQGRPATQGPGPNSPFVTGR